MAGKDIRQYNAPFSHRICEKLEIPDDVCSNCSHIEIVSNCCAMVDGCRGVLEYGEDIIRLNTGRNNISISGNGLTIKSLDCQQAIIEGIIVAIEFS